MSVQVKKLTKRRKRNRAAHHALNKIKLVKCEHCKTPKKPHVVCPNCGYYKGKEVVRKNILSSKTKKK